MSRLHGCSVHWRGQQVSEPGVEAQATCFTYIFTALCQELDAGADLLRCGRLWQRCQLSRQLFYNVQFSLPAATAAMCDSVISAEAIQALLNMAAMRSIAVHVSG